MPFQISRNVVATIFIAVAVCGLHHYVGVDVLGEPPLGLFGAFMVGMLSSLLTNRLLPYTYE